MLEYFLLSSRTIMSLYIIIYTDSSFCSFSGQHTPRNTHGSDERCAGFHGAEASVADLDADDLRPWCYAVALRLVGEVPSGDAGHVCAMSS